MGVVDHPEERLLLRHLRKQAEHRKSYDEPVRGSPRAQTKCRGERVALRSGQPLAQIQERRAELMQACVRELHLVLLAGCPRDRAVRRAVHQAIQQRRLADSGLASYDERLALTRPEMRQKPVQRVALGASA